MGHGRAHIEVRGVRRAGTGDFARRVEQALKRLDGVDWAQVNAVLGRVVVAFDDRRVSVEDLIEVLDEIEERHGLRSEEFSTQEPDHPADVEPLRDQVISLGADAAGIGLSLAARPARGRRLPADAAAILSLVSSTPRLRRELESRLGHAAADLGLALSNAVAQGLTQGPWGLLVDATYRASLVAEITARRAVWQRREPELHARGAARPQVEEEAGEPRVAPLPPGPVERYADRSSLAAAAVGIVTAAAGRDRERARNLMTAGIPKAARLTREAFAAWLGRGLSERGVITLDPSALRRLDRVDTVVIDAEALISDWFKIGDVRPIHDDVPSAETEQLRTRAASLLDPADPRRPRRVGKWALDTLKDKAAAEVRAASRLLRCRGGIRLGLWCGDELVAVVAAVPDLDPLAPQLIAAAHEAGRVMIAGRGRGLDERLDVDGVLPAGSRLPAAIRELQRQGRVVAVVSGRAGAALRTADCGIGVLSDAAPPWQADLLCGPGLAQAIRIVDAIAAARTVSRRGALIALYGSGAAALLALAGPRAGTGGRASLAINSAAAVGVASGAWSGRAVAERPDALATDDTPWHALDADVALDRLHSSAAGLDAGQAHERRARRPETSKQGDVGLLPATLQELANPLTSTLGTAAAMSGATGSLADALLIVSVLGANGLLGGIQRVATERALRGLVQDGAARVRVRRDDEDHDIDAESVVAGDVIIVRAGDAVPADCRILEAAGLEVDESRLTGESRLVTKTAQPSTAASMAERHSMLYEGSLVAAGYAVAVVVAAGPDSELGRTATAATGMPPRSGVQERLRRLTTASLPIALGAGAALVGSGLLRGARIGDRIGSGVSLAVAAVPEGLPVVATVGQIAAARRLSGRQALVRNHSVLEALGRVDVLCFDKTGTLTEGGMRLRRVCEGLLDCPVEALPGPGRHVLATGLRAGPAPDADRMMPHPTDRAVALAASTIGITAEHGLGGWQMLDELPFESSRGYHAALGATPDGRLLCVKGAPETVLPGCVCWRRGEQVRPLGGEEAAAIQAQVARLAGEGYRVLAVAQRTAGRRTRLDARLVTRLEFLGLLALADPVRPQAAAAVAGLREARVKVMMMTGDHPSTAESVARELDILDGGTLLTGADLDRLDDARLAEVLPRVSVFARVTPAHKVRVVQALQAAGHTVAMAGDGANDATAIRLADVGVAFGKSSTDAARQAADLVVTDGRVETLIDAVVEGRAMWASVRDAVSVLLGGNLGEIAFTLGAGLVSSAGSPLNARQLLVVNLLTDLLPSMALAVRPPAARNSGSLLREGPDASMGGALARDTFVRAAATAGSTAGAWLTARATGTPTRAGTVALVTLVATQLGQTVAAGWRSPLVLAASATSAATLAGIVQTPGVSQFFGCRPLGPVGWATALSASGLGTGAAQIASALTRRAA